MTSEGRFGPVLLALPDLPARPGMRALRQLASALAAVTSVELCACGPTREERVELLGAGRQGRVSWSDGLAKGLYAMLEHRISQSQYAAVLVVDSPGVRAILGRLTSFADKIPVVVVELPGMPAAPAPPPRRTLSKASAEAWCFGGGDAAARAKELLPLELHEAPRPTPEWLSRRLAALAGRPAPRRVSASVVIPCWNGLEYTKDCLRSVLKDPRKDLEVIVVDNGSTDGTARYVRSLRDPRLALIQNEKNLGFARAVNQGLRRAKGEHVVWLNNDAVVPAGWLERLGAALERAPWIGAVGPYTNECNGLQRMNPPDYPGVEGLDAFAAAWAMKNHERLVWTHRLVGFCVAHRRSVLEEIGYLDERFGMGTYEDFDFSLRLRQAGYELYIAADVFIHHHGNKTFDRNRVDVGDHVRRNREVFIDKWCRQSLAMLDELDAVIAPAAPPRRRR